ncbi:MAG: pyridoxamine 5'-phosphate oxidase family protein [Proteobacteria bacterium]|nr:pyridoxamine 5'-phosphate oxidase family protein [Pseudomonadota bacterium]
MREYTSDIAFTDTVKNIQQEKGSRSIYANMEQRGSWEYTANSFLKDFIAERDSFYMATVNSEGYPYIQHRGGARGFLKIIDERTLSFADFRGNRQYLSYGNLTDNNKISLFLMDYPNRVRVKVWGTAEVIESNQETIEKYSLSTETKNIEHIFLIHIEAWDRNCPKFITPRFTEDEIIKHNLNSKPG